MQRQRARLSLREKLRLVAGRVADQVIEGGAGVSPDGFYKTVKALREISGLPAGEDLATALGAWALIRKTLEEAEPDLAPALKRQAAAVQARLAEAFAADGPERPDLRPAEGLTPAAVEEIRTKVLGL